MFITHVEKNYLGILNLKRNIRIIREILVIILVTIRAAL